MRVEGRVAMILSCRAPPLWTLAGGGIQSARALDGCKLFAYIAMTGAHFAQECEFFVMSYPVIIHGESIDIFGYLWIIHALFIDIIYMDYIIVYGLFMDNLQQYVDTFWIFIDIYGLRIGYLWIINR